MTGRRTCPICHARFPGEEGNHCEKEEIMTEMHDLTKMAIEEGGRVHVQCFTDPFDPRPWGAAIVRKLALAGAQWGEVATRKSDDGDTYHWIECRPADEQIVTVYLNEADVEALK